MKSLVICWILIVCAAHFVFPNESTKNVVTEIKAALKDHQDTTSLLRYIDMSDEELITALPLSNSKGYTLFAPTNSGIRMFMPQDIGDPYFDPDLRNQVLIRHFVRQRLTEDSLGKLTSLLMASGETYDVSNDNGTITVNRAEILPEVIELKDITIFFVDWSFVKQEEISEAIKRHPSEVAFFGPLPQTPYEKLPKFPSGGYNRVSVTEQDVQEAAQFATKEIAKKEGATTLKQIKSAGTQTFYGYLYKLVLELTKTGDDKKKDDLLTCSAVVFQRHVLNEIKLYESSCERTGVN